MNVMMRYRVVVGEVDPTRSFNLESILVCLSDVREVRTFERHPGVQLMLADRTEPTPMLAEDYREVARDIECARGGRCPVCFGQNTHTLSCDGGRRG